MNSAEVLHFQDFTGSRVNPQVEDGHVKIANDLFEQIMLHSFTKQQLKVVLAVIRKTYGFQKKVDDISLSQLCELTKLHKPDVSVALKQLAAMNVLKVGDGKYAKSIELNKHYDQWQEKAVSESLTHERITNKGLVKHEPQKTIPKDKKNNTCPTVLDATLHDGHVGAYKAHLMAQAKELQDKAWEAFWEEYPRKEQKKPARKLWDKLAINRDLYIRIIKALKIQKQQGKFNDRQYSPMPTTWLSQERWSDEVVAKAQQKRGLVI